MNTLYMTKPDAAARYPLESSAYVPSRMVAIMHRERISQGHLATMPSETKSAHLMTRLVCTQNAGDIDQMTHCTGNEQALPAKSPEQLHALLAYFPRHY